MEALGITWWGIGIFVAIVLALTYFTTPSGTGSK